MFFPFGKRTSRCACILRWEIASCSLDFKPQTQQKQGNQGGEVLFIETRPWLNKRVSQLC